MRVESNPEASWFRLRGEPGPKDLSDTVQGRPSLFECFSIIYNYFLHTFSNTTMSILSNIPGYDRDCDFRQIENKADFLLDWIEADLNGLLELSGRYPFGLNEPCYMLSDGLLKSWITIFMKSFDYFNFSYRSFNYYCYFFLDLLALLKTPTLLEKSSPLYLYKF